MKRLIFRPFNSISAMFLLMGTVFIVLSPSTLISFLYFITSGDKFDARNLLAIPGSVISLWIGVVLLNIVFKQRVVFLDDHLEIHYWIHGTPYLPNDSLFNLLKIPKSEVKVVKYSEIRLYGAFFAKDLEEYISTDSGFLKNQWMVIASGGFPMPIKLPEIALRLRDALLIIDQNGKSIIIDGGNYGMKQVENILFELVKRTGVSAEGRIKPVKHFNNFPLAIIKTFSTLCWLILSPISTIWLEGVFNPLHIPAYQSGWRTVYVISIFLANLSLTGYLASKKQKEDADVRHVKNICMFSSFVLYLIFIVSFVISVLQ